MKFGARAGRMMMRMAVAAAVICVAAGAAVGQVDITDKFKDPIFRAAVYKIIGKTAPAPILDSDVSGIARVDVGQKRISDLSGIEYLTALTWLNCAHNQLTALDVSKNTALKELYCSENQLTTLDMSKNTALTTLYCEVNQLTALDVSKNTALTTLYCEVNQLTALDVSKNTALTRLSCYNNLLTTLDVSKNTALTLLYCFNNQLTTLDVSKNTALGGLDCHMNQLTALDVLKNTALTDLDCGGNQLTTLDVSKNTALTDLRCEANQLTTLDVSKNTALTALSCSNNQLTTLDVSKNTALRQLSVMYNYFTSEADIIGLNKSRTTYFEFDPQNPKSGILSSARTIPISSDPPAESSISPVSPLTVIFTAGPNPVGKSSGKVIFYRNGAILKGATLHIYDASGNFVASVTSGAWDLRDAKGRPVPSGTYVVRGAVAAKGGKQERVSAVVGVR